LYHFALGKIEEVVYYAKNYHLLQAVIFYEWEFNDERGVKMAGSFCLT
jgi:hypothetical protein